MFKKIYDSLSMPVHTEILVHEDYICLKSWAEVVGETSEDYVSLVSPGTYPFVTSFPKSLSVNNDSTVGEFPSEVSGIYHRRLPAMDGISASVSGELLYQNIPTEIQSNHEDIRTKMFACVSYAWIDPTDPSISSGELNDMACWVIGVDRDLKTSPAYNSIAQSYISKAHPLRTVRQYGSPAALFVYQPFKDDKFDTCSMTLKYNKAYGFSTNVSGWDVGANEKEMFNTSGTDTGGNAYNYLGHLYDAFPHFEIVSGGGSIDADGYDTVSVRMVDSSDNLISKDVDIYLESTGGYLPKSRVSMTNGTASFKVGALGLESSDTFKVKIGFKNMTGVNDVEYTVA